MRKLVGEKVSVLPDSVPWLEIEGAQVVGKRVLFAVGIVNNKDYTVNNEEHSWRTRSFIFSRKLEDILE